MEHQVLNVSLIQSDLIWEDPTANRISFKKHFNQVPDDCNLIILPEMFTSGFTMNPSTVAETMDGITVQWLRSNARQINCAICGSLVIEESGIYYNRFLFVSPDGTIQQYDKRHTFNMAGEGDTYQAGTQVRVIDYLGWKILPQVCYDLRFPVFSRNTTAYDLVIYVANWPETRIAAWDTLLKARAIENMSYAIGVNRIGVDGNKLRYIGHSAVYGILGEPVDSIIQDTAIAGEKVITAALLKKNIHKLRTALPFLEDRDAFTLE